MYRVLAILSILCIALITYINKKNKTKTTIGNNILLGFGVFFSFGSIVIINEKPVCLFYSIISLVIYAIYIYKSKIFSKFSFRELKKDIVDVSEKQKDKLGENIDKVKDNVSQKKTKITTVIGALVIVAFICIFVQCISNINIPATSTTSKDVLATYNIPQENIDSIYSTLKQCEYNTYFPNFTIEKSENNEEIAGSIGFTIKNGQQIIGFIDIKDNEIDNIQYSDKILYQNGAIQHTLSEYIISDDEQIDLITKTEENIKSILKSPSTAKFPWSDEWKMSKKDGSIIVQSYVDAENSFGAKTRSDFQVTYTNSTITSLIFDGVEYIK